DGGAGQGGGADRPHALDRVVGRRRAPRADPDLPRLRVHAPRLPLPRRRSAGSDRALRKADPAAPPRAQRVSPDAPNPAHPGPQELLDQEARLQLPHCSDADALWIGRWILDAAEARGLVIATEVWRGSRLVF